VSVVTETTARSAEKYRVTRSRRNVAWTGIGALVVVVVLALFPYIVYSGTTAILVQGLIVLTMASMWNLLAGYGGLVSVGQQAFVGLGAYFILIPAMHGLSPFTALPIAALGAGVVAVPLWWLISRLRSGYFAIATWVLASTIMLFIERFPSIGGGTGMPLPGFTGFDPVLLAADTYWAALAVAVLAMLAVYLLLRSRLGLVLTAIRDDETAARSSGARVGLARLLVFVVAAVGCGAAGGVLAIDQLQVQPSSVFSVQWTAEMAFAVIIGGLGTIEGPIIGTIVYMVLQQTLQSYNAWYLIILGLVAILVAIFARRGIWGLIDEHLHVRLFPVGYYLWAPGETRRRNGSSGLSLRRGGGAGSSGHGSPARHAARE
jgi:branched-chain amino acid transport system permease protein